MKSVFEISENNKPRQSNFELMRIVLILMVLVIHYAGGGGGSVEYAAKGSFNSYFSLSIISFFAVAVNVFVILTGYFSCHKKTIRIGKPIFLYSLVIFYGVVIAAASLLVRRIPLSLIMVERVFPTVFYQWFAIYYCFLYLLIPFLNKLIHSLSKRQFMQLLLILLIVGCGVDTFFPHTVMVDKGYGLCNFVLLYLIGAYLRLHRAPMKRSESACLYLICGIITSAFSVVTKTVWDYNNLLIVFGAIGFFEFFRSLKMSYHPFINYLATFTFAAYIIHNNDFMTWILYTELFECADFWDSSWYLLHLFGSVLGIYLICIGMEALRRKLLGKVMDRKILSISKEIG